MAFGLLLPLRIAQGLMALLVFALSTYVAHWYDADTLTSSPSQINFLVFAPIFSFISIAYLEIAPRFAPKASHPYGHLAFEALNVIFYFAGFVAVSDFISKLLFCRGSVCAAARSDAVFASFSWLLWTGSATLLALEIFKGGIRGADKNSTKAMKEAPAGLGA